MIPRAMEQLFRSAADLKEQGWAFQMKVGPCAYHLRQALQPCSLPRNFFTWDSTLQYFRFAAGRAAEVEVALISLEEGSELSKILNIRWRSGEEAFSDGLA